MNKDLEEIKENFLSEFYDERDILKRSRKIEELENLLKEQLFLQKRLQKEMFNLSSLNLNCMYEKKKIELLELENELRKNKQYIEYINLVEETSVEIEYIKALLKEMKV